ncbi:MAG TPA: deaminase [Candidatus Saccharimonadales bacterium]|nr:deaminase [Candidatus Saccharimonadales bacterium]
MKRIIGDDLKTIRPFFIAAGKLAEQAKCLRGLCGTVVIKDGEIIGKGYNGPAFDDVDNRTCNDVYELQRKPKFDKTCCTHAEWRAIIDACKRNPDKIEDSVLYFMRVDIEGNFTDAGDPYCTTCSRLTLESGIGEFALWNAGGADIYSAAEYNRKSYDYFL